LAKAIVEAIDRLDRRGRIERIGQAPFRDIDEHPEAIRHILVLRAFRSHRHRIHVPAFRRSGLPWTLNKGAPAGTKSPIIDTKDDPGLGSELTPGSSCRGSEP
jgi:hypothetical protein